MATRQPSRAPLRPAPELYAWVRCHFAADLITLQLTYDYRAATPQTRAVAAVGSRLREPEPNQTTVSHELRTIFLGLPTVGLTTARRMLTREAKGTSALLTRTNGEALVLSRTLFEAGNPAPLPAARGRKGSPRLAQ